MRWRCLFGHDWSAPENQRDEPLGEFGSLFIPLVLIWRLCGPPQIVDQYCLRCGKLRTVNVEKLQRKKDR